MSEQTIYNALRAGGLSLAGACAMMGNMWAESGLRSNNVQDNCPMSDSDYTYNVDHGIMTKWQFETDRYGYGLCQWTLDTRKDALFLFAKAEGVSIADEQMQCAFCIKELRDDFAELYKFLCETDDLSKAAERVCAEFERPAVNNFALRINAAQRYYNDLAGCDDDACEITFPEPAETQAEEKATVEVRILRRGDLGRDVYLLQCGLNDMGINCGKPDGDFGEKTETAVNELRRAAELPPSGVADAPVWETILKQR